VFETRVLRKTFKLKGGEVIGQVSYRIRAATIYTLHHAAIGSSNKKLLGERYK
jgi:hypothetical protein